MKIAAIIVVENQYLLNYICLVSSSVMTAAKKCQPVSKYNQDWASTCQTTLKAAPCTCQLNASDYISLFIREIVPSKVNMHVFA